VGWGNEPDCRNCALYAAYKRDSLHLWLWRSTEREITLCDEFMQGAIFAAAEAGEVHAEARQTAAFTDTRACYVSSGGSMARETTVNLRRNQRRKGGEAIDKPIVPKEPHFNQYCDDGYVLAGPGGDTSGWTVGEAKCWPKKQGTD